MTDTLKTRIQNTMDYNDRGTKHIILDSEAVPHIVYYDDDIVFNRLFIEYYCVIQISNAFESHKEYIQVTYADDTHDIWFTRIGRL